jgi:hypothetical protein
MAGLRVLITNLLPAGVTFVSATGTGWTCTNVGNVSVTCTRPALAAGVTAAVNAGPGGDLVRMLGVDVVITREPVDLGARDGRCRGRRWTDRRVHVAHMLTRNCAAP